MGATTFRLITAFAAAWSIAVSMASLALGPGRYEPWQYTWAAVAFGVCGLVFGALAIDGDEAQPPSSTGPHDDRFLRIAGGVTLPLASLSMAGMALAVASNVVGIPNSVHTSSSLVRTLAILAFPILGAALPFAFLRPRA